MLHDIAIFLVAAVIAVPVSRRLGLGSVLGFLAAGMAIGPWGLRLITDVESILGFSEFGVVLLLFLIGLELQPARLWTLRTQVFGLGLAQFMLTGLALAAAAAGLGLPPTAALVAGFGLAMSSTAFVLQLLSERNELQTQPGRAAFSVLLFQDLSVIPFLAVIPLMTSGGVDSLSWEPVLRAVAVVCVLVLAGRYALRPALRALAAAGVPEIFTAAALLVVVGTSLLMEAVGLSMSLGAFLAGMLLADSEYRHELQADLEPFKGLLLGLFFMAVGMSVHLGMLAQSPLAFFAAALGLVAIKSIVLYVLARILRMDSEDARATAVVLSQGGEFAFVIFALAATAGLLGADLNQQLILLVTLSMLLTPPLYALQAKWRKPLTGPAYDTIDASEAPVILAGFGPFGQIIGRLLRVRKIGFTVLEKSWEQVDFVRRFGNKIYYGDAARIELLKAAHAGRARIFVISIANTETSLRIAETVRKHFPHLRIFAVANDRDHAMRLMDMGITDCIRRAYYSSLEMSRQLFVALGEPEARARRDIETFREHDEATLLRQQAVYRDEKRLIQTAQQAARELEQLFEADQAEETGK